MKRFLVTAMLAASAAMFAPSAVPQVTGNAMALNAAAPQELPAVAVKTGGAMAVPVASDVLLRNVERSNARSFEQSPARPGSGLSWVLALGFLGMVVVRRIRASRQF